MKNKNIPQTIRTKIIPEIRKKVNPKKKKNCVMWVMDGDRGIGKTTAALEIQRQFDPEFNILTQISYEYREIVNREMYEIKKGRGHHIDEIRFEKMDVRTREGVMIKKVIKEIRPWQHFITLTTPDVHDIMDVFLKFADYYSFFTKEGTMLLLKKNPKIISGNKFGLDIRNFPKIKDNQTFNKYFVKPALKTRTLIGKFTFPQYTDLFTKEDYETYNKLRIENSRKLAEMGRKTQQELKLERKSENLQKIIDNAFTYSITNLETTIRTRMAMFRVTRQTEYNWRNKLELF